MTERLAEKLTERLLKYELINKEDEDLYCYSAQVWIEKIIGFTMIFLLSLLFGRLVETILFVVFFSAIRKRSGGFHANTYFMCFFNSIGLYAIYVLVIFPFFMKHLLINDIALLVAICVLLIIGSVNHPNMAWNEEEYVKSKRLSRMTVVIEGLCILGAKCLSIPNEYILFMSFGVILSAILLALGKIIKQEV